MPTLGWTPITGVDVNLVADTDFVASLHTSDNSALPDGTQVTLILGSGDTAVSWPATVDGSTVSWQVQSDAVDAAITALKTGRPVKAKTVYSNGSGLDLVWTTGQVRFG